jgi:lysophospholipase L1-like esterase
MKQIIATLLMVLTGFCATAQTNLPYYKEIQAFKQQDSIQSPPKSAILFIGSSSFRGWRNMQESFPKHTIINRGFGGSSIPDVLRYADDIIFPYQPKQIVIYCGENDLSGDSTANGATVFNRFKQLFTRIRKAMPGVPLVYVSMKPSPSRWHLRKKMQVGNQLIQRFLQRQRHTAFVDVWPAMLGADGLPRKELFLNDQLHMKPEGYDVWQQLIEPKLIIPTGPLQTSPEGRRLRQHTKANLSTTQYKMQGH